MSHERPPRNRVTMSYDARGWYLSCMIEEEGRMYKPILVTGTHRWYLSCSGVYLGVCRAFRGCIYSVNMVYKCCIQVIVAMEVYNMDGFAR